MVTALTQSNPEPSTTAALWRSVTHFDKGKINSHWMALRNSIAVAIPLAVGIEIGNPLLGVAIATGALNVAYADGRDPYARRARRMLSWSVLGAIAVFLGSVSGKYAFASFIVILGWSFAAGMCNAISTRAGDLGLNTLVTLVIYSSRGAFPPKGALIAALLVLGGGLLQAFCALFLWPLRRYEPERRAIGNAYRELARQVRDHSSSPELGVLASRSGQVQDTLDALGRDGSIEGERFRMLFDQADRVRLSVFTLTRLRTALAHDPSDPVQVAVQPIDELLDTCSQLLDSIADCLLSGEGRGEQVALLSRIHDLAHNIRAAWANQHGLGHEILAPIDVLVGQLRAISELANHSLPAGSEAWSAKEEEQIWKLQLSGWLSTIRANLDLRSSIFRHALRLAVCVALSEAIGRSVSLQRSYWFPMTVAVILKPDFTTTISRGVLRLMGTFSGLLMATALYHILPYSGMTQLVLVGGYTFALRLLGPANYGAFTIAISGLIVFLIAATGVPPGDVVVQRALNTTAGGIFALLAYVAWPTWERKHVSEAIAEMMDATREYFRAVVQRFERNDEAEQALLEETRDAWRRARTNAEASVDRVSSEPRTGSERFQALSSIMASSHTLVHAIMGLEAELVQLRAESVPSPGETFKAFSQDVEFTLYFLAASLRGSAAATETLPKLREDYRRMVDAREEFLQADAFLLSETDRITTSLNTLREQVMRHLGKTI